jgi:putative sterol carrier protein
MDQYPRVIEMRQRVLAWLAAMQAPELGDGVHAESAFQRRNGPDGMYLPGTYNATACLFLLGAYETLAPAQADSIAGFLNQFQRPDGAYRIPEMEAAEVYYPDFEYIDLHTTNYVLGALALLGRKPAGPLAFMERYNTPAKLETWLDCRQMAEPWTEGNYIVNLASFYAWLHENGNAQVHPLLNQLLDWHQANQDPASGYWYDPATNDLTSAMAGATHNLHLYYYLRQPVPRFEKIVDHCLAILEGVSSACLDVDVIDILANLHVYGYRRAEIEAYMERKITALLDFQNPDGGFADLHAGLRLFDGWERYQEPQGLSNCFATWFRCAAIGMICRTLYPDATEIWHFRNTLGIGYFDPHPPSAWPVAVTSGVPSRMPTSAPVQMSTRAGGFGQQAQRLQARIQERLAGVSRERLLAAGALYQINIDGTGGGSLTIAINDGMVDIKAGIDPEARVCLSLTSETLEKLLDGRLNATVAYMTKKLKLRGDISLAMKLESLLK